MARYRKKPVEIKAHQWFKNGDHPEDGVPQTEVLHHEGTVVRYYRRPDDDGSRKCDTCGYTMHEHGWIDNPNCSHTVCPGDYIISDPSGHVYPCKPDIFKQTYEPVQ